MANDGLLPKKFFAAVHPKFRTPWKNTILVGLLAAVVGSVTPIDEIGKMVNIGTLLAFVIVSISVMVLRYTNPSQPRPFRTPWVPLVPILGVIANGYMMLNLGMWNWIRLVVWLAIGLGRLLHLQREAQPGAGAAAGESGRTEYASRQLTVLQSGSPHARRAFLFYSLKKVVMAGGQ